MHTDIHHHAPKTAPTATKPKPIPGTAFLLRKCRTCGQEKPLRSYYKQRKGSGRLRLDCIACVKEDAKGRRLGLRSEEPPETRRCRKCRTSQSIDEFPEDRRHGTGYALVCRTCERQLARQREQRRTDLELPDKLIPLYSELREQRIDLGIAIAHATCPPGHCRSREEIAAYTGLHPEAVRRLEVRALWKMRLRARKILEALGLEHLAKEGVPQ